MNKFDIIVERVMTESVRPKFFIKAIEQQTKEQYKIAKDYFDKQSDKDKKVLIQALEDEFVDSTVKKVKGMLFESKMQNYELEINGNRYKTKLNLSNESKTISKILKITKDDVGGGHDGKKLTLYPDGGGHLDLDAYPGGPNWRVFIQEV